MKRIELPKYIKRELELLRQNIREAKNNFRRPRKNRCEYYVESHRNTNNGGTFEVYLIGGVHTMPNAFLNFHNRKKIDSMFCGKKPTTKDNYIGVELECFSEYTQKDIALKLLKAKLDKYVCIKHDRSIQTNGEDLHSMEIAILCKEDEYEKVVGNICKVLNDNECRVNKSCGFHVHLDMRHRNKELAYSNLVSAQPILYAMNPPSRRNNRYCQRTKTKRFSSNGNRYKGINGTAWRKYNTVEIRIHAGTINPTKIINWIKLLVAIVNTRELVKRSPSKLSTFINKFNIDLTLALYISQRIELFANDNTNKQAEQEDYEAA